MDGKQVNGQGVFRPGGRPAHEDFENHVEEEPRAVAADAQTPKRQVVVFHFSPSAPQKETGKGKTPGAADAQVGSLARAAVVPDAEASRAAAAGAPQQPQVPGAIPSSASATGQASPSRSELIPSPSQLGAPPSGDADPFARDLAVAFQEAGSPPRDHAKGQSSSSSASSSSSSSSHPVPTLEPPSGGGGPLPPLRQPRAEGDPGPLNQGQASQASPVHREGKHRAPPRRMPEIPTRDDFDGSPSALAVREKETELRLGNRWRDVQVRLAHRALDGGPALAQHLEYFAPKSEADIAAMERLVDWVLAGNAEPVPRTQLAADPVEARVRQVNILCETLRARLPELVARKDAKRMAEVLLYLVRNEVSSRALDSAISMAWFRDSCAQLSASAVAYSASFGIFNGILAALMDRYGGDEHQLDPRYYLIPGLVMPVTAMVASRVLRQGEMLPGWTLPTEADSKGMPVAAINTWSGYFRVATQFLSFFGSLGYAARNYSDRLEQVQARIYGGYLATAGVVLHRMMFLRNRDFPWLKAKDDLEGRAMVGTIRELNGTPGAGQVPAPDWRDTGRSLSGAVSAYPARMATGLASLGPRDETTLGSLDMLGRLEDERAMRPAGAAPLPPRRPARVGEEVCHSFSRLVCLLVPLGITYFGFSKLAGDAAEAMTSEQRLQLALAAMVSATILIKTWGLGTASVEYRLGQDPSLQREKEAREARAREFMAYRSGIPVAQPAAAAARARDPLEIAVADGGRDLGRAGGLAEEVAAALPPARVVSAEEATRQRERKEAEGGSARRDGKGHRERVDG